MIRSSILRAQTSSTIQNVLSTANLGCFPFFFSLLDERYLIINTTHSLKHSVIHPETKLKK